MIRKAGDSGVCVSIAIESDLTIITLHLNSQQGEKARSRIASTLVVVINPPHTHTQVYQCRIKRSQRLVGDSQGSMLHE